MYCRSLGISTCGKSATSGYSAAVVGLGVATTMVPDGSLVPIGLCNGASVLHRGWIYKDCILVCWIDLICLGSVDGWKGHLSCGFVRDSSTGRLSCMP